MSLDPAIVQEANEEFLSNHPERNGELITKQEVRTRPDLVREWSDLYRNKKQDKELEEEYWQRPKKWDEEYTSTDFSQDLALPAVIPNPSMPALPCTPSDHDIQPLQEKVECDFDKLKIKCLHCSDADKEVSHRSFSDISYWFEKDGLCWSLPPSPPGSRKVQDKKVFQMISNANAGGNAGTWKGGVLDKLSVEVESSVGSCGKQKHHRIRVDGGAVSDVAQDKLEVELPSRDSFVPAAWGTLLIARALERFFFPKNQVGVYSLIVESCGYRTDGKPCFKNLALAIEVFPGDQYELSIELPARTSGSQSSGQKKKLSSQDYSRTASKSQSEDFGRELESKSEKTDYDHKGMETGFGETHKIAAPSLTYEEKDSTDSIPETTDSGGTPSVAMSTGQSLTFKVNGSDYSSSLSVGDLIEKLLQYEETLRNIKDLIQDFQPGIGWMIEQDWTFLKGQLNIQWSYKESHDNTVFSWWQGEVDIVLASYTLKFSFGISKKVWGVGLVVRLFAKGEFDIKGQLSAEATLSLIHI